MAISKTDRIQQASGGMEQEPQESLKNPAGYGLHQAFSKDVLSLSAPANSIEKSSQSEMQKSSFLSKITPWWVEPDLKIKSSTVSAPAETTPSPAAKTEPISLVPVLDNPEIVRNDLKPPLLPQPSLPQPSPAANKSNQNEKISHKEVMEALSLMSDRTIEDIMRIILKAQFELEKENAAVAEGTYSKFQNLKKAKEKMLEEIKDVLEKDENRMWLVGGAQNVAVFANVICGVATFLVAVGFPYFPAFMAGATMVAPIATAALTAITTGARAYFERKGDEHKAKHDLSDHQDKIYGDLVDEARERLSGIADMDAEFKERMIYLLKRFAKMGKLVLQR